MLPLRSSGNCQPIEVNWDIKIKAHEISCGQSWWTKRASKLGLLFEEENNGFDHAPQRNRKAIQKPRRELTFRGQAPRVLHGSDWPKYFWKDCKINYDNPLDGLFKNPFCLMVRCSRLKRVCDAITIV